MLWFPKFYGTDPSSLTKLTIVNVMNFLSEITILIGTASFIGVFIVYKPDGRTLFDWTLRGLVLLGIVAFVVHNIDTVWKKLKSCISSYRQSPGKPKEHFLQKEKAKKEEKQNQYTEKAHEFEENVLKPREAIKNQQKLEELYKFSGPAWKGPGHKTGGKEALPTSMRQRNALGGRDAAAIKSLPEMEIVHPPQEVTQEPQQKIELPDEPTEGEGVIALAFRTPYRVVKRRFYVTDTIQILLDYMTTLGYHQKLYCLCSSYPRKCVSEEPDLTLQDVGITHGCTFNIEEKD